MRVFGPASSETKQIKPEEEEEGEKPEGGSRGKEMRYHVMS